MGGGQNVARKLKGLRNQERLTHLVGTPYGPGGRSLNVVPGETVGVESCLKKGSPREPGDTPNKLHYQSDVTVYKGFQGLTACGS